MRPWKAALITISMLAWGSVLPAPEDEESEQARATELNLRTAGVVLEAWTRTQPKEALPEFLGENEDPDVEIVIKDGESVQWPRFSAPPDYVVVID